MAFQNNSELPKNTYAAATAGTTQTQAGATALTASMNVVTTGNANDGVALPSAPDLSHLGATVIVQNASANALNVYPAVGSGGTIDGGSANAADSHAASATFAYVCTGVQTWRSVRLS